MVASRPDDPPRNGPACPPGTAGWPRLICWSLPESVSHTVISRLACAGAVGVGVRVAHTVTRASPKYLSQSRLSTSVRPEASGLHVYRCRPATLEWRYWLQPPRRRCSERTELEHLRTGTSIRSPTTTRA